MSRLWNGLECGGITLVWFGEIFWAPFRFEGAGALFVGFITKSLCFCRALGLVNHKFIQLAGWGAEVLCYIWYRLLIYLWLVVFFFMKGTC